MHHAIMLWGGINSIEQIEKLIALGSRKVSISSAAIKNPELISEAAISRIAKYVIIRCQENKSFWEIYGSYS